MSTSEKDSLELLKQKEIFDELVNQRSLKLMENNFKIFYRF